MKKLFVFICVIFVVASALAQTRKVGDIITINGVKGVVFEVSSNGQHGKVLSIAEEYITWNAAPAWCTNLGEGWVLPTRSELSEIAKKSKVVDAALVAKGNESIFGKVFWTSEPSDEYSAWSVYMDDGFTGANARYYYNYARAVTIF